MKIFRSRKRVTTKAGKAAQHVVFGGFITGARTKPTGGQKKRFKKPWTMKASKKTRKTIRKLLF